MQNTEYSSHNLMKGIEPNRLAETISVVANGISTSPSAPANDEITPAPLRPCKTTFCTPVSVSVTQARRNSARPAFFMTEAAGQHQLKGAADDHLTTCPEQDAPKAENIQRQLQDCRRQKINCALLAYSHRLSGFIANSRTGILPHMPLKQPECDPPPVRCPELIITSQWPSASRGEVSLTWSSLIMP